MKSDYRSILKHAYRESKPSLGIGEVAHYIPALAGVNGDRFGFALASITGDALENFSI